jgi:hypothetical protein
MHADRAPGKSTRKKNYFIYFIYFENEAILAFKTQMKNTQKKIYF